MLTLSTDTYELVVTWENTPIENRTIFVMKKLLMSEWTDIQDRLTTSEGAGKDAKLRFLAGTSTRLKIQKCVVGWRNVIDTKGEALPCTDENKSKLPVRYLSFLEEHIDDTNRLSGASEEEAKNS